MDFTDDDIASVGDELTALDLTAGETEALRTIVAIAADAGCVHDPGVPLGEPPQPPRTWPRWLGIATLVVIVIAGIQRRHLPAHRERIDDRRNGA